MVTATIRVDTNELHQLGHVTLAVIVRAAVRDEGRHERRLVLLRRWSAKGNAVAKVRRPRIGYQPIAHLKVGLLAQL